MTYERPVSSSHPAIRDTFAAFQLSPVELSYRVSGQATPARELIITGDPA